MPLSPASIKCFDQVKKGNPARFVMVTKGVKVLNVVAYRKGSLESRKNEAQTNGPGEISFGVVDGAGQNIVFKLARADGFNDVPLNNPLPLRGFLNESEFNFKPTLELVDVLPEIVMEDEGEQPGVTPLTSASSNGHQPTTNGEEVSSDPRLEQLRENLKKAKTSLEETAKAVGTNPQAKELLVNAAKDLKSAREWMEKGNYNSAVIFLRAGVEAIKKARELGGGQRQQVKQQSPLPSQETRQQKPEPSPHVQPPLESKTNVQSVEPVGKSERPEELQHTINRTLISGSELIHSLGTVMGWFFNQEAGALIWSKIFDSSFKNLQGFTSFSSALGKVHELLDVSCGEAIHLDLDKLEQSLNDAIDPLAKEFVSFQETLQQEVRHSLAKLDEFAMPFLRKEYERLRKEDEDESDEDESDDDENDEDENDEDEGDENESDENESDEDESDDDEKPPFMTFESFLLSDKVERERDGSLKADFLLNLIESFYEDDEQDNDDDKQDGDDDKQDGENSQGQIDSGETNEKSQADQEKNNARLLFHALELANARKGNFQTAFNGISTVVQSWSDGRMKESFQAIQNDPGFGSVKDHITLGEGIHAKTCGVSFSDVDVSYRDENLTSEKEFGKGGQNTVSKLVYKDGRTGIFKPEQEPEPEVGGRKVNPVRPHSGERNIASRKLAELLGSDVIVKSSFAVHKGKVGLLMDLAPGGPVQKSGDSIKKITKEMLPGLHTQLNQLEWCDMLCAQVDRNPLNYMIEVSSNGVQLTGIDNDLSFAENKTSLNDMSVGYNRSACKPKLIDRQLYNSLSKLKFDDDILPTLKGRLTTQEINATRGRFEDLQRHANSLDPDYVVDDWKTWKTKDGEQNASGFLASQEGDSLFRRDFKRTLSENKII